MIIAGTAQLDAVQFGEDGLLPVVTQHALTGEVLMLAWANRDAVERTLDEVPVRQPGSVAEVLEIDREARSAADALVRRIEEIPIGRSFVRV